MYSFNNTVKEKGEEEKVRLERKKGLIIHSFEKKVLLKNEVSF